MNVVTLELSKKYTDEEINSAATEIRNKLDSLYDDLPPIPFLISKTGAVIPTLSVFNGNIKQYTFAVNDEVFGASEVTHLYKNGTDLMPHIHWATNGLDATNRYVKWELEYSWARTNDITNSFSTPTVISFESEIPANTNSLTHYSTQLPIIDGTNITVGTYLCWRVRRIASTGLAPTSKPFGLAFGVHVYQSIKI